MSAAPTYVLPREVSGWDQLKRPIWLYDPVHSRGVYANREALALWGAADLDELLARDFSKLSPAVKARTDRLAAATAQGAAVSERWTFYPRDVPTTVNALISSFELPDGRVVLLFEASPLEVEDEAVRALEALRHTPSAVSLFDRFGGCLMSNPATYAVYGEIDLGLVPRFVDRDQGLAFLDTVLERGQHSEIAEVRTATGPRRMALDARTLNDPVTGQASVILTERPASASAADPEELFRLRQTNDELKRMLKRVVDAGLPSAA